MIFFDLDHTLLDLEGADKRALPRYRETSVLGELLPWERFYEAWETIRKDCFQRYLDGEYTDSIYHYDLGDGGMKLSDWNGYDEILPEEKVDLMDQNMEMLFSGEAFDF